MLSGENLYAFTGVKWYGLVYHSQALICTDSCVIESNYSSILTGVKFNGN